MDDRLIEVYELAMMGDLDAAREMLNGITTDVDQDDLTEMRQFLDDTESGEGEVKQMDGADAMGALTGATPLPSGEDEADGVAAAGSDDSEEE